MILTSLNIGHYIGLGVTTKFFVSYQLCYSNVTFMYRKEAIHLHYKSTYLFLYEGNIAVEKISPFQSSAAINQKPVHHQKSY